MYLKNKLNKNIPQEDSKHKINPKENDESNSIYVKLKKLWNNREIEIIKNILLEMDENRNDEYKQASLIEALESILQRKEESVQNLLHETVTTFK